MKKCLHLFLITLILPFSCFALKENHNITTYHLIRPIIEKKTHLPTNLPPARIIRQETDFDTMLNESNINFAYRYAYSFNFDYTQHCNGAPVCSVGSFYVAKLHTHAPQNHAQSFPLTQKQIKQIQNAQPATLPNHQAVSLNNHITAYIEIDHTTGTGGSLFRTLTWIQDNTLYQLTLKGISTRKMVLIANATINPHLLDNSKAASTAK